MKNNPELFEISDLDIKDRFPEDINFCPSKVKEYIRSESIKRKLKDYAERPSYAIFQSNNDSNMKFKATPESLHVLHVKPINSSIEIATLTFKELNLKDPDPNKIENDEFLGKKIQKNIPTRIIAYCRVSSSNQKVDLKNQRQVLEIFTVARGLSNVEWVEEIGGGMNFSRKKFLEIMDAVSKHQVNSIVIAHKDRLVRFGYDWFEHFCKSHGCTILVLNQENLSPEEEMVQDLMTIVHCFSSRLYGLRNYKKNLNQALSFDTK